MPNCFEIQMTFSSKQAGRGNHQRWITHKEKETRPTYKDAMAYIRERFGKCKRTPMYVDRSDGTPQRIGWVFCYREKEEGRTFFIEAWTSILGITVCNPFEVKECRKTTRNS